MIYYRTLELENYPIIIEKCLEYLKTSEPIAYYRLKTTTTWYYLNLEMLKKACPELQLAFDKYDLIIVKAAVYVMHNPKHSSPHVDAYPALARVNLPLINCENTYTHFYTSGIAPRINVNPDSGIISYRCEREDPLVLVDTFELKQATVIRIKEIHMVEMPENSPAPRISLTLGFDKDPIYLLDN